MPARGVGSLGRHIDRFLRRIPIGAAVFVAGLLARLGVILRHNGLHGSFGYDAAVYFAAADAFMHGRLPYRDFVLLHPPALMLALSPFALLTHVLSDESAFTIGVLSFSVLGALNGVLVVRICRRLGFSPTQVAAGGLFYALWFGSIGAEYLTKLEPLGNAAFLLALLALLRAKEQGRMVASMLGGLALGCTLSVKIWWIVPVLFVLGWYFMTTRNRRSSAGVVAGILIAVALIDLPFFVISPGDMWSSVVADQLGRHPNAVSPLIRLGDLSTAPRLIGHRSTPALALCAIAFLVIAALVVRRAWGVRSARFAAALFVVQLGVVLVSPSWFSFYTDYLAVAAALTVGAAAARRPAGRTAVSAGPRWTAVRPGSVAVLSAITITTLTLAAGTSAVSPFRGAAVLTRAVRHIRCVMSDSPMSQIELDALTRGLTHGCRNWVDVTGRTYGPDYASASRVKNTRWQRDLRGYLRSGGAVIIVRASGTGLDRATRAAIRKDGVLVRAGGHVVYRVKH